MFILFQGKQVLTVSTDPKAAMRVARTHHKTMAQLGGDCSEQYHLAELGGISFAGCDADKVDPTLGHSATDVPVDLEKPADEQRSELDS